MGEDEYEFSGQARIIGGGGSRTIDVTCYFVTIDGIAPTYSFDTDLGQAMPLLVSSNLAMRHCYTGRFTILTPPPAEDYADMPFYSEAALAVVSKRGAVFSGYFYSDQAGLCLTSQTFVSEWGSHATFQIEALQPS